MRPNNIINLKFINKGKYDPTTGKYEEDLENSEEYICTITQMSIEKQLKLFGNFEKNTLIVRINNYDGFKYNSCEINNKKFTIKKSELKNNNNLTLLVVENNE